MMTMHGIKQIERRDLLPGFVSTKAVSLVHLPVMIFEVSRRQMSRARIPGILALWMPCNSALQCQLTELKTDKPHLICKIRQARLLFTDKYYKSVHIVEKVEIIKLLQIKANQNNYLIDFNRCMLLFHTQTNFLHLFKTLSQHTDAN